MHRATRGRRTAPLARWPLAIAALTTASCIDITAPNLPSDAVHFDAPAVYHRWWAQAESCSGLTGDLAAVSWFVVPGGGTVLPDGSIRQGTWHAHQNAIVLAEEHRLDGALVRHEMVHALLQKGGHPRETFADACAGIVVCGGPCLADAGAPAPADPAAIKVMPGALETQVVVTPVAPSSDVEDGMFQVAITARNPHAYPVSVTIPPDAGGLRLLYEYAASRVDQSGWTYTYGGAALQTAAEQTRFRPGQARTYLFDLRVGEGEVPYRLPPGQYEFSGAFGGRSAPALGPVAIGP